MEIPLSKEDQDPRSLIDNEELSNIDEKEEQEGSNNAVTSEEGPSSHGNEHEVIVSRERAFAPLQMIPKEHSVIELLGSDTLLKARGGRMDQHPMMRSMHPCLFQGVCNHEKGTELCSKERDTSVQPSIQSTSDLDVSLHGGIPPGRPPDGKKNKVFSQPCATVTYLATIALGESPPNMVTFENILLPQAPELKVG